MPVDRERALGAGFDGYLEKPISVRDFPDQVRGHVRDPRRCRREPDDDATVLVVDDLPQNRPADGRGAVPARVHGGLRRRPVRRRWTCSREGRTDLVLLDILMPGLDGYETCRRIRENPATSFLPVVMVTASGDAEKVRAIEAGADDFVTKPLDQAELLARVRSLVRVKRYHDTVVAQAAALRRWNQELEARVAAQVAELERLGRLRRFLSPQVAQLVARHGATSRSCSSHRREIIAVFTDLRGFTAVRRDRRARRRPWRCWPSTTTRSASSSSPTRAPWSTSPVTGCWCSSTTRCPARTRPTARCGWRWRCGRGSPRSPRGGGGNGYDLGFGVGIAQGYATLGRVGFDGRYDYAAIGTVTNLAARLCARRRPDQILVTQRVGTGSSGGRTPRGRSPGAQGFSRPMEAYEVIALQ